MCQYAPKRDASTTAPVDAVTTWRLDVASSTLLVPLTIHLISPNLRGDYALLEITNPFWTLYEVGAGTLGNDNLWGIDQTSCLLLTLVPIAALLTRDEYAGADYPSCLQQSGKQRDRR